MSAAVSAFFNCNFLLKNLLLFEKDEYNNLQMIVISFKLTNFSPKNSTTAFYLSL